jgi:hypothetical protein
MPYSQSNRLPNQSLAESFELPENRYLAGNNQPAPAPQQGGYQPTLPLQGQPQALADVEGLTSQYYDVYGKLQSLAQGMQKDYGLDVTKPDFTQPGGGLPFQTYQKLSGMMMTVSNKLGNRLKEQQQVAPYKYTGQTTGSGEQGDPYVSTHLVPELMQAQKRAEDTFYTKGDAKQAYEANIKPIEEELALKAASGDPFWVRQYEIAKRLKTTYQTHPSYFKNEFDDQKAKLKAAAGATREIGIARKLTAEKNGFWEPGSYEVRHGGGRTYAYKPAEQGLKGGVYQYTDDNGNLKQISKIVDGWERGSDGKTYMIFKPESEEVALPETERKLRVDNMTGDQLTAVLQQYNPKLGATNTLYQAMDILGHATDTGGLNEQSLFDASSGEGTFKGLEGKRGTLDTDLKAKQEVNTQLNQLLDKAYEGTSWLPNWLGGRGEAKVKLPDGTELTIKPHKTLGKFFIVGDKDHEEMKKDDVIKYLEEQGYFGEATKIVDPAKQKADELIKKYQ